MQRYGGQPEQLPVTIQFGQWTGDDIGWQLTGTITSVPLRSLGTLLAPCCHMRIEVPRPQFIRHYSDKDEPDRGQGLNHALQNAAVLVQDTKSVNDGMKTLSETISIYEDEMRPRACQEVRITLKQANMTHDWEQLMQSPVFKLGTIEVEIQK
jgi:hypothetical protein